MNRNMDGSVVLLTGVLMHLPGENALCVVCRILIADLEIMKRGMIWGRLYHTGMSDDC